MLFRSFTFSYKGYLDESIFTNIQIPFFAVGINANKFFLTFIHLINDMLPIPESELIINKRGAIYHLDLRPEELAQTVIVVGDQDRVPKVSKHFDSIEHRRQHREFVTHTGRIGNLPITVMSTGIGTDNIDIALNELDAVANIDFDTRTIRSELKKLNIIRLGTCGALQADIPIDSLVVSTHGLGLDNVLNYYQTNPTREEKIGRAHV